MKLAIVTDSTAALTQKECEDNHIYIVKMNVIINDQTYADRVEINNETLFSKIDEGASYSTSQPSPDVFLKLYEKLLQDYDHVLSLHTMIKTSGAVNAARIASTMLEEKEKCITVLDSDTSAVGLENMILKLAALAKEGMPLEQLLRVIEFYKLNQVVCFTIDDLGTLVRTGRMSKTAATFGNMLNIRPIVGIIQTDIRVIEKVRTKKRMLKYFVEEITKATEQSGTQLVRLAYIGSCELVDELKRQIETACPQAKVYEPLEVGSAMAVHFGRGGIGLAFMPEAFEI